MQSTVHCVFLFYIKEEEEEFKHQKSSEKSSELQARIELTSEQGRYKYTRLLGLHRGLAQNSAIN